MNQYIFPERVTLLKRILKEAILLTQDRGGCKEGDPIGTLFSILPFRCVGMKDDKVGAVSLPAEGDFRGTFPPESCYRLDVYAELLTKEDAWPITVFDVKAANPNILFAYLAEMYDRTLMVYEALEADNPGAMISNLQAMLIVATHVACTAIVTPSPRAKAELEVIGLWLRQQTIPAEVYMLNKRQHSTKADREAEDAVANLLKCMKGERE